MKITGTMVYQDFEGGFWGILGDDDKKYRPVDEVPAAVRKDGLRIEAELEPASVMSFAMWGRSVHVRTIQPLSE